MKNKNLPDAQTLRHLAEEQLIKKHAVNATPLTEGDTVKLIHELEVHEIELEMQCTELLEAEERLQNSETRYRRLFESAKDGILILDAYSGEIVDVNPFLVEMIGYSHEELLGKELWEIGTFKNIAASKDAFLELQSKNYIRFEEMPLETKDGKSIDVEFVSNVYLEDHKKVIQCNIRNITDRNRALKALKESETRLRELNATKDKFFSIISHDLRSPFNSIISFSNLLVDLVKEKDYEGIEGYAGIIRDSSWQAMDLLSNLIEWSRSQSGRMEFNPEYLNIEALINDVIKLTNGAAQQKAITVSKEVPHNDIIFADKAMLSIIVRNLVSNAIKYTNQGGAVVISAKQIEGELSVAVCDNGVGIEKGDIEKLFRIDQIPSKQGTQSETGTGLGLLLCKEFIAKHNGKIWVESKPGKGSEFHFTVPTIDEKEKLSSVQRPVSKIKEWSKQNLLVGIRAQL